MLNRTDGEQTTTFELWARAVSSEPLSSGFKVTTATAICTDCHRTRMRIRAHGSGHNGNPSLGDRDRAFKSGMRLMADGETNWFRVDGRPCAIPYCISKFTLLASEPREGSDLSTTVSRVSDAMFATSLGGGAICSHPARSLL